MNDWRLKGKQKTNQQHRNKRQRDNLFVKEKENPKENKAKKTTLKEKGFQL